MHSLIHHVLVYFTAQNAYNVAAFVLTGAGSVYSVQLIKILKGNKVGKNVLRGLNFLFNALYVSLAAIVSGGIALGADAKTVLALTAFSAGYYRLHNSVLFQKFEKTIDATPVVDTGVTAPVAEQPQFAS